MLGRMLTRLAIRNVVLIEALDLAFPGGLGVLTGETGAGKSILLDALGLVLGNRAESGLVRAGEEQASVTASFEFAELPEAIRLALAEAEVELEPGEHSPKHYGPLRPTATPATACLHSRLEGKS